MYYKVIKIVGLILMIFLIGIVIFGSMKTKSINNEIYSEENITQSQPINNGPKFYK